MKKLCLLFAIMVGSICSFGQVTVKNLLCENATNPLSIDVARPRFSWQLSGNRRNILQTAYEIKVSQATNKGSKPVWNSGKVISAQSVFIPYGGPSLESDKRYYWQVRV